MDEREMVSADEARAMEHRSDDCGEPHDAATARAVTIYRAHLARMEREAVEALLSERAPAQRARAAADRHTAELALGTAEEVSR